MEKAAIAIITFKLVFCVLSKRYRCIKYYLNSVGSLIGGGSSKHGGFNYIFVVKRVGEKLNASVDFLVRVTSL